MGAIYLIALLSLGTQLLGLVGREGIQPAAHFLEAVRAQWGPERYWLVPTLCWLNATDAFLQFLCGAGIVMSVLLLFDVAPALVLLLLWGVYLSLVTVCREFMSFQWDNLLLEAGFLAIFLAPLRLGRTASRDGPPPAIVLWLLRWLLVRLVCSSGFVKLASGDPTWRTLTALTYHYETQPLPTWISWYVHHLPAWVHRACCAGMFVVELAVPPLLFGPRRWQTVAAGAITGFQLLIFLTGNYCFFNLLTMALCVLVVDDTMWSSRWRMVLAARAQGAHGVGWVRRWPRGVLVPVASVILVVSGMQMSYLVGVRIPPWRPLVALQEWVAPLRTINTYGLFAVMTTSRPEIILEGSEDGTTWLAYEFRDKPGDPSRRPRFIAPHQPRLDWQMWFAALSDYRRETWFLDFCARLLQGSPTVVALLRHNPFPQAPPRYLRALVYDYRFTDPATRRAEGAWWRRELKGTYCPTLSLRVP